MTKLLAATLVCVASTASATNLVATDSIDRPAARSVDGRVRPAVSAAEGRRGSIDGRIGMLLGGADVGDADGFSIGISGGLGYKLGDLSVRGLFDYYKVGDSSDQSMPRHGRAARIGGALRYSFANLGNDGALALDFWGEVGAGYEHVAWLAGGVLDRPDGELAIGFDLGGRGAPDRRNRRREFGYFMALRSLLGEAPEMAAVPTCGGPCTRATTPPRTDVSIFFELGVQWGR